MISIKIHQSYRNVVAICDVNLIGKRVEEGKRQLDCRESFYKGKDYDKKEAINVIKHQAMEDSTFNIVGPESVKAAIEAGIIRQGSLGKVHNIPFALTLI